MSAAAYYNDNDPHAAAWLRALIAEGLIAPGVVDERSIAEIKPDELTAFTQCHFFAGIGGWSLALRLAGWPDDRRIWTGSCPCQPFSPASIANGHGKGRNDARHLWPVWARLVRECKPPAIAGEQVASAVGESWWDEVASDLEGIGYACGAAILPARVFGADHERKRLFWLADSRSTGWQRRESHGRIFSTAQRPFSVDGNPLARARRALDGDFNDLLLGDGVSVAMERRALKGYGNAIVPEAAAEFLTAWMQTNPTPGAP